MSGTEVIRLRGTADFARTTNSDLIARWETRRSEFEQLHAQVDGASLIGQFLRDLETLASEELTVSLAAASERTGYTADHLGRLIKSGRLVDYGRKHAPRVKVSECPKKGMAIKAGRAYNPDTDARLLRVRRLRSDNVS